MEISSGGSCEFIVDGDEVKMEGDKAMKYLGLGELGIYSLRASANKGDPEFLACIIRWTVGWTA